MMSLFGPKGLKVEVTEGIDLERGVDLTGSRITVGSGPADDLRLGAADVVSAHLVFERRADGKGWEYFSSDRGLTQTDRGNPRTGSLRPGQSFSLGAETRLEIRRTDMVAAPVAASAPAEATTVPLAVAVPAMAGMAAVAVGAVLFVNAGDGGDDSPLWTTGWVVGAVDLSPAVETCLVTDRTPTRPISADDPSHAYWQVLTTRGTDPEAARAAERALTGHVRQILADAHLLHAENRHLEASRTLRRLEYVLPVGSADCPILEASRYDLTLLEYRGAN